jgi:hypothetical protein
MNLREAFCRKLRRFAKLASENARKMSVAGKTKVESKHGQVDIAKGQYRKLTPSKKTRRALRTAIL